MVSADQNARFSAVIPVLNEACTIPTSVPIPLSRSMAFQKIKGEDLAIITETDEEAVGKLKGGSYTLYVDDVNPENLGVEFLTKISAAAFAMNILGNGTPLSFNKAYIIRKLRKTRIHKFHPILGQSHSNLKRFEIKRGTYLSYASELSNALLSALEKHPALRITISRYNSATGRLSHDDKLIDLCIALESIFQSNSEISFQFSLYNSILSETDSKKRLNIFKLLKKLYGEHSNIVHGNREIDAA